MSMPFNQQPKGKHLQLNNLSLLLVAMSENTQHWELECLSKRMLE